MKQIIIRVLIVVLSVAIVATGGYFLVTKVIMSKDDNTQNNDPSTKANIYTNRYNDAILSKKLTTANYSGTYKYSSIVGVTFNKYDQEQNPGGLTDYDIQVLLENRGITGGIPAFNAYLGDKKKEQVYGKYSADGKTLEKEGSGELLTIITPVGENGQASSYGLFTKAEKNKTIANGKVYGNEDLAEISFDDKTNRNFLISLNYTTVENAVMLSGEKATKSKTIYVFEDIYSTGNPNLRLFTITYEYTLLDEDPSHPSGDLEFGGF